MKFPSKFTSRADPTIAGLRSPYYMIASLEFLAD